MGDGYGFVATQEHQIIKQKSGESAERIGRSIGKVMCVMAAIVCDG